MKCQHFVYEPGAQWEVCWIPCCSVLWKNYLMFDIRKSSLSLHHTSHWSGYGAETWILQINFAKIFHDFYMKGDFCGLRSTHKVSETLTMEISEILVGWVGGGGEEVTRWGWDCTSTALQGLTEHLTDQTGKSKNIFLFKRRKNWWKCLMTAHTCHMREYSTARRSVMFSMHQCAFDVSWATAIAQLVFLCKYL